MRRFDRLDAIIAGGGLAFVLIVTLLVYTLHLHAALRRLSEERAQEEATERSRGDDRRLPLPTGRRPTRGHPPRPRPTGPDPKPTVGGSDRTTGTRLLAAEGELYAARFALFSATWDGADTPALHRFLRQCDPRFRRWEWGWLSALGKDRSVRLRGGLEGPAKLMFSPDGRLLAVGCTKKGLHFFDSSCGPRGELGGGELLHVLPDSKEWHLPLAFSPDSRRFAFPGPNKTLLVFDASLGRSIIGLKGHEHSVKCCAWSPDGELVASGGYDGLVILWNAETGEEIRRLSASPKEEEYDCIQAVTFDRRGRLVASSDNKGRVAVWDARSGKRRRDFKGEGRPQPYRWLRFGPNAKRLAGVATGKHVVVWDVHGRKSEPLVTRSLENISYPAVSDDLRYFAHAGHGGSVVVEELMTGRKVRDLRGGPQRVVESAFDPASKTVAAGYLDGGVRAWDLGRGETVLVVSGHRQLIRALTFSPDGTRLASSSGDGTARIWRIAGRPVTKISHRIANGFAFDPSWTRLAVAGQDGKIGVWDVGEVTRIKVFSTDPKGVRAVTWGPVGNVIACGGSDHRARILDVGSGKASVAADHPRQLHFVAFDSKGERLFSGCEGGTVKVRNINMGGEVASFRVPRKWVPCYALSPDASRIAAGAYRRGPITIHEIATGKVLVEIDRELEGYEHGITALAFSPDGRLLASASEDWTVRLWDALTGRERLVLSGHTKRVTSIAFSPDGNRLASGGWDRTVRLWDTVTGIELLRLETKVLGVEGLAFSPDGRKLAVFCGSEILIHEAAPWREEVVRSGRSQ